MEKIMKYSFFKELSLRRMLFLALVFGFLINNSEGCCCGGNKKNESEGKTSEKKKHGEGKPNGGPNENPDKEGDCNNNPKKDDEEEQINNEKEKKDKIVNVMRSELIEKLTKKFKELILPSKDSSVVTEKDVCVFVDLIFDKEEPSLRKKFFWKDRFIEDFVIDFKSKRENVDGTVFDAILSIFHKESLKNPQEGKKSYYIFISKASNPAEGGPYFVVESSLKSEPGKDLKGVVIMQISVSNHSFTRFGLKWKQRFS